MNGNLDKNQFRISYAEEPIVCKFELENIIKQTYEVANIQLIYEFFDENDQPD